MTQTRLGSFIEALVNVLIGYWIAVFTQHLIFPLFGYYVSFHDNLLIGLVFTVISIARSYVLRRFFNSHLHRFSTKLVERIAK